MQHNPAQPSRSVYHFPTERVFSPVSTALMPMSSFAPIPFTEPDWVFPPNLMTGFPEASDTLLEMLKNDTHLPLSSPPYCSSYINANSGPNTDLKSTGWESIFEDFLDLSQLDREIPYQDAFGVMYNALENDDLSAYPSSAFCTETGINKEIIFSDIKFQPTIFLEKARSTSIEEDEPTAPHNHELIVPSTTSLHFHSYPPSGSASPSPDSRKRQRSEDNDEVHESQEQLGYIKTFDARGLTIYICRTCRNHKTRSHGDITRHLESLAHKPRSHKCESCSSAFTRADALTRHVKGVHNKVRKNTKGRGKRARVN